MKTKNTPKIPVAKATKVNTPKVASTPKVSAPKVASTPAPKVAETKPTTPSFRADTCVGKLYAALKDGIAHKPETLWNSYESRSKYQILTDLRRAVKPYGIVINRTDTGSYQLVAPASK